MKKYLQFVTICAVVFFAIGIPIQAQTIWTEYSSNPIFGEGSAPAGPKAYYCNVVYDASSFSGHGDAYTYKMWYGTSSSQTGLAYSNDGITWNDQGVVMTNGYHAQVIYDAGGFGGSVYYKMWYWSGTLYTVGDIRYAESVDGITWTNDQPSQNGTVVPFLGEPNPTWNRGSYGPCTVLYNSIATNIGTDPFNYAYAMYYDGTTGGGEITGLAYSVDGITWNGYDADADGHADPVLLGTALAWDNNYAVGWTILKNASNDFEMWYSGGNGAMNHGIGYATSSDGINWIKDASNPIFYKDDGITWRDNRTYTPSVIKDGTTYKMWFTGKDIANGDYSIGYATGAPPLPPPTEVWVDDDYCDTCPNDGHIWGYDVFDNIQDGIDAVDGSTVYVGSGTYAGNITVNKSVTILGDPGDNLPGPGANAPIIDGGSLPGSAFFIANGVTNVTIKGFEIRNFTSNNTGIGNGISAWQASTSYITIQDNYFHHLGYNGVLVGNDGAAGDHTNWLIKGNIIEEFYYIGFELTNTSNSSIEDNVIHMNTPIIGAIFSSARRSETSLSIINNQIDGTPSALYPVIYVYAYDVDMPSPNLDNVLIEGNSINSIGTPYQIYIRNVFTGTVTDVQVHRNNLSTLKNLTSAQIDATCNWWGSVDGPSGAAISGDVVFLPWLVTSDLNGSCAGGTLFQAKSSVLTDLQDLFETGTGDKKTDKILEKAIKHLENSMADELWEDNNHLNSIKGIKVFEEEKTAVHELMKIEVEVIDVSSFILKLVEIDRMLAQTVIDEAVDSKDIEKAEIEMVKADQEFGKGNYDKAIEHYKHAWHHIIKAMINNASESFVNSDATEASAFQDSAIPDDFGLGENYPNPFNPTTLISYNLPEASQVTLAVYDIMGKKVKTLVQEFQPAGNHSVVWNATNDIGTRMSGGMYFYQIKAGSFLSTHKMILMK